MDDKFKQRFSRPIATIMAVAAAMVVYSSILVAATERIGLVKTYQPVAYALRQGVEVKLGVGSEIYEGDTITTDADGAVGIIFNDGAVLTLGPSGKLIVEQFLFKPAQKNVSFLSRVMKGSVSFISGAIGRIAPGSVQFITPTATLGLRGTKILIEVE
jgi:hypothetical protein